MNYRITLPADYDMGIIRHRVATRGHALDDFPGLGLKAYLIKERGVAGSAVNQYAPFYLWRTAEGMNSFLWGPGFRGLVADFGRPVVEHWTGLAFRPGPAVAAEPLAAVRRAELLAPGEDPADAVARAVDELAAEAARPGVHSAAVVIDPRHWELVRFTLWEPEPTQVPEEPGAERCRVLHLSRPGLDALGAGRQW
jgi:hypothetical protein